MPNALLKIAWQFLTFLTFLVILNSKIKLTGAYIWQQTSGGGNRIQFQLILGKNKKLWKNKLFTLFFRVLRLFPYFLCTYGCKRALYLMFQPKFPLSPKFPQYPRLGGGWGKIEFPVKYIPLNIEFKLDFENWYWVRNSISRTDI